LLYVPATLLRTSMRSCPQSVFTFATLWRISAVFPNLSSPSTMGIGMITMALELFNTTRPRTLPRQDRLSPSLLSPFVDIKIINYLHQTSSSPSVRSNPTSTGALSHLVGKAQ
ncbi:hypothetical protein K525DRAFT_160049, partial [Schizophyllum commune Loenen D]